MKIISFSTDNSTLEDINHFQQKGYKGRSEVIRAAIKALIEQDTENEKLKGIIDAILLVKHEEKYTESLLEIRHKHQSLIQTHIHTHLENHSCLELFVLKGPGEKIKNLLETIKTSKKTQQVRLNII